MLIGLAARIKNSAQFRWKHFWLEREHRYSERFPHGIARKAAQRQPGFRNIPVFVESGTFRGNTTAIESKYFEEVHTIELNPELYKAARKRFWETPNVTCHFGDSAEVINRLAASIDRPAVFFLDAHWSGDNRVDWEKSEWSGYEVNTAYRGDQWPPSPDQQCPLVDEARSIGELFRHRAVIVIDDWSVIGSKDKFFKGEDWSTITEKAIFNALGRDRILEIFISYWNDKPRMVILLDKL